MSNSIAKPRKKRFKILRLILGDQLNAQHSWFKKQDKDTLYLIAELNQETRYVKHHIQKICAFFLAMQNFAHALRKAGHHVLHLNLDESCHYKDLNSLILTVCEDYGIEQFQYQRPDEWRLLEQLEKLYRHNKIAVDCVDTEHFLLAFDELEKDFTAKQHTKMEFFYRKMRKRFHVLMDGDKPLGGAWNFDAENRNKLKKNDHDLVPKPLLFSHDVSDILARIKRHRTPHFGKVESNLIWPVTEKDSLQLLKHFCEHCLPYFGHFQDAMTNSNAQAWTLFHSRLSFSLNTKMISPRRVLEVCLKHYMVNKNKINLAQIEGFVRQILGWREYVRGMYWVNMPAYRNLNYF